MPAVQQKKKNLKRFKRILINALRKSQDAHKYLKKKSGHKHWSISKGKRTQKLRSGTRPEVLSPSEIQTYYPVTINLTRQGC